VTPSVKYKGEGEEDIGDSRTPAGTGIKGMWSNAKKIGIKKLGNGGRSPKKRDKPHRRQQWTVKNVHPKV